MSFKDCVLWPVLRAVQDPMACFAIKHQRDLSLHRGITIANIGKVKGRDQVDEIKAAVDLIARRDARRFARLKRNAHYICAAGPSGPLAFYLPHSKICVINVPKLRLGNQRSSDCTMEIARLLVFCSVKGCLYSSGIKPMEHNIRRIDALCEKEMRRFSE